MTDSSREKQYEKINSSMRSLGVEAVLRSGAVTPVLPYARPAKFGIAQPEVAEALGKMRDFNDWPGVRETSAHRYETLTDGMAKQMASSLTARDAYVHASYTYHLAQLYCRDSKTKARLHSKLATYEAACRFFEPPTGSQFVK